MPPASASPPERSGPAPALVTVYSRPGCHLCEEAIAALQRIRPELGFELEELDISSRPELERAYFERIPVILLDGEELCEFFLDEPLLRERLESSP